MVSVISGDSCNYNSCLISLMGPFANGIALPIVLTRICSRGSVSSDKAGETSGVLDYETGLGHRFVCFCVAGEIRRVLGAETGSRHRFVCFGVGHRCSRTLAAGFGRRRCRSVLESPREGLGHANECVDFSRLVIQRREFLGVSMKDCGTPQAEVVFGVLDVGRGQAIPHIQCSQGYECYEDTIRIIAKI